MGHDLKTGLLGRQKIFNAKAYIEYEAGMTKEELVEMRTFSIKKVYLEL